MIIGTWFVLQGISKSSEFAGVGSAVEVGFEYRGMFCSTRDFQKVMKLRVLAPPSRLALIIGAWFVFQGFFKSSEFADVGSAVEVGFDYRGLVCITMDF